jgi:hypothetical protein
LQIKLLMGIFHGWDSICAPVSFECVVSDKTAKFEESDMPEGLTFDLPLMHIPRMARLSFTLFSIVDKRANRKTVVNAAQPTMKHGKTVGGWKECGVAVF